MWPKWVHVPEMGTCGRNGYMYPKWVHVAEMTVLKQYAGKAPLSGHFQSVVFW